MAQLVVASVNNPVAVRRKSFVVPVDLDWLAMNDKWEATPGFLTPK